MFHVSIYVRVLVRLEIVTLPGFSIAVLNKTNCGVTVHQDNMSM